MVRATKKKPGYATSVCPSSLHAVLMLTCKSQSISASSDYKFINCQKVDLYPHRLDKDTDNIDLLVMNLSGLITF